MKKQYGLSQLLFLPVFTYSQKFSSDFIYQIGISKFWEWPPHPRILTEGVHSILPGYTRKQIYIFPIILLQENLDKQKKIITIFLNVGLELPSLKFCLKKIIQRKKRANIVKENSKQ